MVAWQLGKAFTKCTVGLAIVLLILLCGNSPNPFCFGIEFIDIYKRVIVAHTPKNEMDKNLWIPVRG